MRSLTDGVETNAHLAAVALWIKRPVRLSIAVADPPACLRTPGSLFCRFDKIVHVFVRRIRSNHGDRRFQNKAN